MKKIIFTIIFIASLLISSCSLFQRSKPKVINTTPIKKEIAEEVKKEPEEVWHKIKYISFKANAEFSNGETLNEFTMKLNQANDSLGLKIQGPLNIVIAELFATPEYFLLLDKWGGNAYEGKPTKANFRNTLQIPISYSEITGLVKLTPYGDEKRLIKCNQKKSNQTVYYFSDVNNIDSLWLNSSTRLPEEYKHISTNKKESYSVKYKYQSEAQYPYYIEFSSNKMKLLLNLSEASFNKFKITKINIPDKIVVKQINVKE